MPKNWYKCWVVFISSSTHSSEVGCSSVVNLFRLVASTVLDGQNALSVAFAHFLLSFFIFNSSTLQIPMVICVPHFFPLYIWSMLFYFSLFFLSRKIAAIFLRSPIFRKNFTEFSSDALPCRVHPTHYLITISTTAKFIVDILSSCWCCLHVALCRHVSQRTSQNMK